MGEGTQKRKWFSWVFLFLLVSGCISSLTAFRIERAGAADTTTITINPDGSISPPTTLISTSDSHTYYLTANVTLAGSAPFCWVKRGNIVIDGNGHEIQGTGENAGFYVDQEVSTYNLTFKNLIMKSVGQCIDEVGERVRGATVTHCYFSAPWYIRLGYWQGTTGYANVSDNEFVGYGAFGSWEMWNSVISRNIFSSSFTTPSSVSLINAANSTISENQGRVSIDLTNCPNSKISNNTLVGLDDYSSIGIIVYALTNVTVTGNSVAGFGLGIEVSNAPGCLISENKVWNTMQEAIYTTESPDTQISKNFLTDSGRDGVSGGIFSQSNCTVWDNVISNNGNGITIGSYPSFPYCKIYHNHFINNTYQARINSGTKPPEGVIVWDNGYPSGGNYWSDYTGVDLNQDGIGDSPCFLKDTAQSSYGIYMGRDRFPLIASPFYGPSVLKAFFNYTISPDYEATFDGSLSYASNSTIVNYEWDFGDGTKATGMKVTHKYSAGGTAQGVAYTSASQTEPAFSAALKVTDNKGATNRATRTIARGNIAAEVLVAVQLWSYDATIKLGELISNKATDFLIRYTSTFPVSMRAHVKLETPGFLPDIYEFDYAFAPGDGDFYLGQKIASSPLFKPVQKPTVSFKITIDPYNTVAETDETDNTYPSVGFKEAKVNATEALRILFVPVRFKNEDGYPGLFTGYSRAELVEHAVESVKYIEATYPVPEGGWGPGTQGIGVTYDCSCFNSAVTAKSDATGEEMDRPTTLDEANEVFANLTKQLAAKAGYQYDRVVGVVRTDWFLGIPGWDDTDGYAWGTPLSAVVTLGNWKVTAHELGHTYGIYDHSNDRWMGYYVLGRTEVQDAQTFMSTGEIISPPAEPTYRRPVPYFWIRSEEYNILFKALRDPFDPEILFFNADFWRNGNVILGNLYRYPEGFPTFNDGDTGNYSIVQLNSLNNVLSVVGFNVTYENLVCGHPEIVPDTVSLSFTIPYASGTKTIQVRDRLGNIVASKTVSNNPPSVHVASPNGGEILKSSQTQISWEASDLDGDPLTYNLLVSDDGGATWDPVATDLKQKTHNLILTGFSGGNKYLVKVIAGDGVNTAEDVSDGYFTIASFTARMVSVPQMTMARGTAFYLLNITSYGGFSDLITLNASSSTTNRLNFTWYDGTSVTPVVNGSTYVLLDVQTLTQIQGGNHTLYLSGTSGNNTEVAVTYLYVEPYGSITINDGAAYTNSTSVTLELTAIETTWGEVRFSNDGVWNTEDWETPVSTRNWTLLAGEGVKTVYYLVQDDEGLTETYNASIILDATPPVANAGQNQAVLVGTSASFNGSGSTDNNAVAEYLWDFGDSATGTGVAPSHTYSAVGTYTVRLTVKDAAGNSAASSATVTIEVMIPEFPPAVMLAALIALSSVVSLAFRRKRKS